MTSVNPAGKVVAATGGCGVLGQAVIKTLLEAGAKGAVIDHVPAPSTEPPPGGFCGASSAAASAITGVLIPVTGRS